MDYVKPIDLLPGRKRLAYLRAREGMTPNHKKLLRVYREDHAGAGIVPGHFGAGVSVWRRFA